MPRIRAALGLAATSRPPRSTISTPSSSDSTSERNASRSRADARHVARQTRLSAPMKAECTSAQRHGEFGLVVVDDLRRDALLHEHVARRRSRTAASPRTSDSAATITKKWKYAWSSPPVMCTSSAEHDSRPTVTTSDCARRPPSRNWASTREELGVDAVQRRLRRPLVEQQRDDGDRGDVAPTAASAARDGAPAIAPSGNEWPCGRTAPRCRAASRRPRSPWPLNATDRLGARRGDAVRAAPHDREVTEPASKPASRRRLRGSARALAAAIGVELPQLSQRRPRRCAR